MLIENISLKEYPNLCLMKGVPRQWKNKRRSKNFSQVSSEKLDSKGPHFQEMFLGGEPKRILSF